MSGTLFDLDKQLAKEEYGKWPGRCFTVEEFDNSGSAGGARWVETGCLPRCFVRVSATCRGHERARAARRRPLPGA